MNIPMAPQSLRFIATALTLMSCVGVVDGARAQGKSDRSGVPEAVRELEEAEARLRGGIYQVPIPATEAPSQAPSLGAESRPIAPSPKAGEPFGIDITPAQESGEKSSSALADIAARVAALQARAASVRTRVLLLQDQMAARLDDVGYARVSLVVKDPGMADGPARYPLAVHEISATLDDVPLVERQHPRRLEKEATFALYEGPLPSGKYELHVRLVVGLLAAGWPARVGQGRWLIEESLTLENAPTRGKKGIDATVVVEPSDGDGRPSVRLQVREAR